MFNRKGVVYKYFVRLLSLQSKASDVWTHSHSLFLTVTNVSKQITVQCTIIKCNLVSYMYIVLKRVIHDDVSPYHVKSKYRYRLINEMKAIKATLRL